MRNRSSDKREYYLKKLEQDPEYWIKKSVKERQRNPEYVMWYHAKRRAEAKGREFTIQLKDVVIPTFCPVLGYLLKVNTGVPKAQQDAPSLHRIDSDKGYTPDNIAVVSWRANDLMKNGTLEEFKEIVRYMNGQRLQKGG